MQYFVSNNFVIINKLRIFISSTFSFIVQSTTIMKFFWHQSFHDLQSSLAYTHTHIHTCIYVEYPSSTDLFPIQNTSKPTILEPHVPYLFTISHCSASLAGQTLATPTYRGAESGQTPIQHLCLTRLENFSVCWLAVDLLKELTVLTSYIGVVIIRLHPVVLFTARIKFKNVTHTHSNIMFTPLRLCFHLVPNCWLCNMNAV